MLVGNPDSSMFDAESLIDRPASLDAAYLKPLETFHDLSVMRPAIARLHQMEVRGDLERREQLFDMKRAQIHAAQESPRLTPTPPSPSAVRHGRHVSHNLQAHHSDAAYSLSPPQPQISLSPPLSPAAKAEKDVLETMTRFEASLKGDILEVRTKMHEALARFDLMSNGAIMDFKLLRSRFSRLTEEYSRQKATVSSSSIQEDHHGTNTTANHLQQRSSSGHFSPRLGHSAIVAQLDEALGDNRGGAGQQGPCSKVAQISACEDVNVTTASSDPSQNDKKMEIHNGRSPAPIRITFADLVAGLADGRFLVQGRSVFVTAVGGLSPRALLHTEMSPALLAALQETPEAIPSGLASDAVTQEKTAQLKQGVKRKSGEVEVETEYPPFSRLRRSAPDEIDDQK